MIGDWIEGLWRRRDALEDQLSDPAWEGDREGMLLEFGKLEDALGLREGAPVYTGDPLTDYLIYRSMTGEITPEDLELDEAPR